MSSPSYYCFGYSTTAWHSVSVSLYRCSSKSWAFVSSSAPRSFSFYVWCLESEKMLWSLKTTGNLGLACWRCSCSFGWEIGPHPFVRSLVGIEGCCCVRGCGFFGCLSRRCSWCGGAEHCCSCPLLCCMMSLLMSILNELLFYFCLYSDMDLSAQIWAFYAERFSFSVISCCPSMTWYSRFST